MTNTEWRPSRLDELGFVGRGKSRHRPRNDARLYGGPYPFIQTAEIMHADPYITDYSQTYTEFGLRQSKLWPPNTLCMTIAGANTAETAILKFEACFPDSIVGFIPNEKKADLHFIKYSLDLMKEKFRAVTRGATQDNLSIDKLLSFLLPTPPLPVQRRIAGILSAYDKLIENNQRRIKILEEMAQYLYREWFVHFRFPGHDTVKMVPSPLGEIPQGWDVKRLGDVVSLITKGTTPTTLGKQFQREGLNFLKAESIDESGALIESKLGKIDPETHELLKRSQLSPNDILFSIAGVIGRVCIVPSRILPANTNQALAIIRCAVTFHVPYLYMALRDEEFRNYSFGRIVQTAQANVSLTDLKTAPIPLPPDAVLSNFNVLLEPLMLQIQVLSERIQNLRRTRDLLLPRLLSGQIPLFC